GPLSVPRPSLDFIEMVCILHGSPDLDRPIALTPDRLSRWSLTFGDRHDSSSRARVAEGGSALGGIGGSRGLPPILIDPLLFPRPLLVPQHELLDLARRRLRQVAELDRGGALEVRDHRAAVVDDLALAGLQARLQRDERLGTLAPLLVG